MFFALSSVFAGCSTNPATGDKQFTALLPMQQEASVGAQEHAKVQETFGDFIEGPVADYVRRVGNRIAPHTERSDVQYKFYVLDSPIVNAFAIPGGYIYVSRGLLALANDEAELAAVLAHEIGHVTGRHAAERVSQGFLVGLGAAVLGAATGSSDVAQAAGLGSELYIKSYSRGQEHQADELGVRYLHRAGYDPGAMASFLASMGAEAALEQKISGTSAPAFSYFSTHPQTSDRVAEATAEARKYGPAGQGETGRNAYLAAVDNLVYGDSAAQGFVRGQEFYHPGIGFTFRVPGGFKMTNTPEQVVADNGQGTIILFDAAGDTAQRSPYAYLTQGWLKGETVDAEAIEINGMRAATASFGGTVRNRSATIRVVAIEWQPGKFFRFQMAIPQNAGGSIVEELKRTTYSFRRMTDSEKLKIKPKRLRVVTASAGDNLGTMAGRMAFPDYREAWFRVLNGLSGNAGPQAGQQYKIVTE